MLLLNCFVTINLYRNKKMADPKNKKPGHTLNYPALEKKDTCMAMDSAEIPVVATVLEPHFPAIPVTNNIGTRRRKAGERISNSAEKLRLIMNGALDAII